MWCIHRGITRGRAPETPVHPNPPKRTPVDLEMQFTCKAQDGSICLREFLHLAWHRGGFIGLIGLEGESSESYRYSRL